MLWIHERARRQAGAFAFGAALFTRASCAGLVSFAAVTGLLIGIGRRAGTPWRPLNAAAHLLIGARADGVWNFQSGVTPMGVLVVLGLSMMAGFAAACVTVSRRTPYVILAAAGVAIAGYFLHVHFVARAPGGLADLLSVGELRALYLALALALAGGIRLALPSQEGSRTSSPV